jgi:hypothetical protein
MQGQTRDQAAEQLGWSRRTLQRRLEQGLTLLRGRLARHGMTMSVALLALGLWNQSATAAVAPLVMPTVRAASAFVTASAAASISAQTALLASTALRGLALVKMKLAAILVLTLGLLTVGGTMVASQSWETSPAEIEQGQGLSLDRVAENGPPSASLEQSHFELPAKAAPVAAVRMPQKGGQVTPPSAKVNVTALGAKPENAAHSPKAALAKGPSLTKGLHEREQLPIKRWADYWRYTTFRTLFVGEWRKDSKTGLSGELTSQPIPGKKPSQGLGKPVPRKLEGAAEPPAPALSAPPHGRGDVQNAPGGGLGAQKKGH